MKTGRGYGWELARIHVAHLSSSLLSPFLLSYSGFPWHYPINVVCAGDVLIVPTLSELFDYASAQQFFDMLQDLLNNVDLKGLGPDVRIIMTK